MTACRDISEGVNLVAYDNVFPSNDWHSSIWTMFWAFLVGLC